MIFSKEIIDSIPLGLLIIDPNYDVVHANRLIQEWGEFDFEELSPNSVFNLLPQFRRPIFRNRLAWSLETGAPALFSPQLHPHILKTYLGDMTQRSFETIVVPIQDHKLNEKMLLITFSDVSMLVQQTKEVETLRKIAMEEIMQQKLREEDNARLIVELREALKEIKTLSGFIPICANCKKVRDDQGFYQQIEHYITEHSEAQFTHGICPTCAEELYPSINFSTSE